MAFILGGVVQKEWSCIWTAFAQGWYSSIPIFLAVRQLDRWGKGPCEKKKLQHRVAWAGSLCWHTTAPEQITPPRAVAAQEEMGRQHLVGTRSDQETSTMSGYGDFFFLRCNNEACTSSSAAYAWGTAECCEFSLKPALAAFVFDILSHQQIYMLLIKLLFVLEWHLILTHERRAK